VPTTLGEHINRRRLEIGLTQKEVANGLGVVPWTVLNWEKGRTKPPIASIAAIIKFLGYDPFPEPKTLPDLLFAKRREMGWSMEQAAGAICVDPGSWRNWEGGRTILYRRHRTLLAQLLDLSADALDAEMAARWNRSHEQVG